MFSLLGERVGVGGGGGAFKEKGKYTKHLAEIFPDCRFVMFELPSHFSPLRVLGEGGGGAFDEKRRYTQTFILNIPR